MNADAFSQSLALSIRPVLISHCAVEGPDGNSTQTLSGTDHLSDGAIRAMAKNGGVICLHFVTPDYIRAHHGTRQATVADWADHAAYIRDLVGIDYIAMGPDYFPEKGLALDRGRWPRFLTSQHSSRTRSSRLYR
jgi:membrane dipeptidase